MTPWNIQAVETKQVLTLSSLMLSITITLLDKEINVNGFRCSTRARI